MPSSDKPSNFMGAVLKSSLAPGTLARSGSLFLHEGSPRFEIPTTDSFFTNDNKTEVGSKPLFFSKNMPTKDISSSKDMSTFSRRGSNIGSTKRKLSAKYSSSTQEIQQNDLSDRCSSKLTLDEELYDILAAYGYVSSFHYYY
uniref:CDKL2 n=1 Tax=Rhabditophanes sp. KR3021 TaxID=114890 RepID=A0AC35UIC4_9BILA